MKWVQITILFFHCCSVSKQKTPNMTKGTDRHHTVFADVLHAELYRRLKRYLGHHHLVLYCVLVVVKATVPQVCFKLPILLTPFSVNGYR